MHYPLFHCGAVHNTCGCFIYAYLKGELCFIFYNLLIWLAVKSKTSTLYKRAAVTLSILFKLLNHAIPLSAIQGQLCEKFPGKIIKHQRRRRLGLVLLWFTCSLIHSLYSVHNIRDSLG